MNTETLQKTLNSLLKLHKEVIPFFNYEFVVDENNYKPILDILQYLPKMLNFGSSTLQDCILYDFETMVNLPNENKLSFEKGLLLYGGVGTGKTDFLKLFCFIQNCCNLSSFIQYAHSRDLIQRYQESGIFGIREYLSEHSHLIIDEIGLHNEIAFNYGNKTDIVSDIILTRYEAWKNRGAYTFFSTNLSVKELKERYDERVFSRICEMCNFVLFESPDRRDTPKINIPNYLSLPEKIKRAKNNLDNAIGFLEGQIKQDYLITDKTKDIFLEKVRDIWREYPILRQFILSQQIPDIIKSRAIISEQDLEVLIDKQSKLIKNVSVFSKNTFKELRKYKAENTL